MATDDNIEKILIEIRDTLKTQQKRNDEYLKKAEMQFSKNNAFINFAWWCFAVFAGTFLAGVALKVKGIIN